MMTFNNKPKEAYVWIWLPHEVEPVVAGKLESDDKQILFNYGRSYLERKNAKPPAISIHEPELPLTAGMIPLQNGLHMPGCIRDAAPDAWGRRVIHNKLLGKVKNPENIEFDELTYLLHSGSDRIGALDFQLSPSLYEPRLAKNTQLDVLLESVKFIEKGEPLLDELGLALFHGTSVGGARPKALIEHNSKKYVAKFSSSTDVYSVIKAEYIAMRLAALTGINTAQVLLHKVAGKDILLVERFDRVKQKNGWSRKAMISALTLFGLDDMMARYASYEDLAEIVRHRFTQPKDTLKELFSRLVFNILCGNTDDHARNHAAFWDGTSLSLTPAYDICPQARTGGEASQAMRILGENNLSKLSLCVNTAYHFLLDKSSAKEIIDHQIKIIEENWDRVCDEAELNKTDRKFFWKRQFLNAYIFE